MTGIRYPMRRHQMAVTVHEISDPMVIIRDFARVIVRVLNYCESIMQNTPEKYISK